MREKLILEAIEKSRGWATKRSLQKMAVSDYYVLERLLKKMKKDGKIKSVMKKNNPFHQHVPSSFNKELEYWEIVGAE